MVKNNPLHTGETATWTPTDLLSNYLNALLHSFEDQAKSYCSDVLTHEEQVARIRFIATEITKIHFGDETLAAIETGEDQYVCEPPRVCVNGSCVLPEGGMEVSGIRDEVDKLLGDND